MKFVRVTDGSVTHIVNLADRKRIEELKELNFKIQIDKQGAPIVLSEGQVQSIFGTVKESDDEYLSKATQENESNKCYMQPF